MFETLQRDIEVVFERDPAVRSVPEILLCYPGVHALWGHRLNHWLWQHGAKLLARWLSHVFRFLTGIEIHPGAQIGPGFFIDHGLGVVIGETAEVGPDVTLYHNVTLGGTSLEKGKRHPTLECCVVVGAGAQILGAITIGENSRIGANAVVVNSVPPDSVVVGVPGRVIKRSGTAEKEEHRPDLDHASLPDLISTTLHSLIERVETLERRLDGDQPQPHTDTPHADAHQIWHGEDFSL
jgi:serine O-acetyltransferase